MLMLNIKVEYINIYIEITELFHSMTLAQGLINATFYYQHSIFKAT